MDKNTKPVLRKAKRRLRQNALHLGAVSYFVVASLALILVFRDSCTCEDSLITCSRGISTIPENCAAAIETVVVAAVESFIDPDPETAIKLDRTTVSDWVVVLDPVGLDPVRGTGICSDRVAVMGSKSSDLAVVIDSEWFSARDSDRLAAMDSKVAAAKDSDRAAAAVSDWAAAIDSVTVK